MTTIQVVWATAAREDYLAQLRIEGFEPVTTRTVETDAWDGLPDLEICETMFRDTNLYEGAAWDLLQPLPEKRTHTALSVGDYVVIDGRMYRCASVGWKQTDTFEAGLGFLDPPVEETF
jgi:hypothetical protein